MASSFQMIEEGEDDLNVQILDGDGYWLNAVFVADEFQQQTKGIAVTGDRLRADPFLIAEILDEEALQQRTDLICILFHSVPPLRAVVFKELCGGAEQFRSGGEIPEAGGQIDMAQINRQIRQERANIGAGFIPLPEPVDGEAMAKRMQRGMPLSRTWFEAKPAHQTAES